MYTSTEGTKLILEETSSPPGRLGIYHYCLGTNTPELPTPLHKINASLHTQQGMCCLAQERATSRPSLSVQYHCDSSSATTSLGRRETMCKGTECKAHQNASGSHCLTKSLECYAPSQVDSNWLQLCIITYSLKHYIAWRIGVTNRKCCLSCITSGIYQLKRYFCCRHSNQRANADSCTFIIS